MIKIRRAKKEDVPKISKLVIELSLSLESVDFFKKNIAVLKKGTKKYILGNLKNKNSCLFVAEDHGKVVGFVHGEIEQKKAIYQLRKIGYIAAILVEKGYRSQGLGKKMMTAVLAWLKKQNIKACTLNVLVKNQKALKFYKKLGFRENRFKMVKRL